MNSDLLVICKQLFVKNITPTVALLRAKSSTPLSIPQAVAAVKEWNHIATTLDVESVSKELNETSTRINQTDAAIPAMSIDVLEKRLAKLEEEINIIRNELTRLKLANYTPG